MYRLIGHLEQWNLEGYAARIFPGFVEEAAKQFGIQEKRIQLKMILICGINIWYT
jgi:hypothetical protein